YRILLHDILNNYRQIVHSFFWISYFTTTSRLPNDLISFSIYCLYYYMSSTVAFPTNSTSHSHPPVRIPTPAPAAPHWRIDCSTGVIYDRFISKQQVRI